MKRELHFRLGHGRAREAKQALSGEVGGKADQVRRERPILFTPANAQLVHDSKKTQTRRLIKPQPIEISWFEHQQGFCARVREGTGDAQHPAYVMVPCPFGTVGDRLWVREAWAFPGEEAFMYRGNPEMEVDNYPKIKWTPSIHMPRWACRTVLEITDIRVQRLQEISEEDARTEGIPATHGAPLLAFHELWDSIHGPESWDANPWVWVLEFRRVFE